MNLHEKKSPNSVCIHASQRKLTAFTLIEVAIVLIIVALLAGGVVKGMELLEISRSQKAATQLNALASAWYGYLNRFSQLPGDDPDATSRFNVADSGDGDHQLSSSEQPFVWQHLHASNLVVGSGSNPTLTPWANAFNFSFQNNAHYLCIEGLGGERAHLLDVKLDDSDPAGGLIRVLSSPPTAYSYDDNYEICYRL